MIGARKRNPNYNWENKTKFFSNFISISELSCIFALSLALHPLWMCRVGDKTYWKAFTTLGFWLLEIVGKFQIVCQEQGNGECPLVVIYTALIVSKPLVYSYANGNFGHSRVVSVHTAWGFDVARFDKQGNSYEPQGVERATVQGFTSLFCVFILPCLIILGCCSPRP